MTAVRLTARQIAELVGGELIGEPDIMLAGVAALDRATAGELSFLASSRYLQYFQRTSAGAVLVAPGFRTAPAGPATRIVVNDPQHAFGAAAQAFYPPAPAVWGVAQTARIGRGVRWSGRIAIGPGAMLGQGVHAGADCVIASFASIGDGVRLGDACRVGAHATVHAGTVLGSKVIVGPGACVGGPGFGFARDDAGYHRVPHVGGCIVGNDVDIGANSTVDRGSAGDTVIGAGTKIDNLVHIGHNTRIGSRCMVMAQVGLAGSVIIEDDAILAGQAGIADHIRIGANARVAAQSGVIGDVPPGATVSGYPARSHREVLRQAAALRRLALITGRLERLTAIE